MLETVTVRRLCRAGWRRTGDAPRLTQGENALVDLGARGVRMSSVVRFDESDVALFEVTHELRRYSKLRQRSLL